MQLRAFEDHIGRIHIHIPDHIYLQTIFGNLFRFRITCKFSFLQRLMRHWNFSGDRKHQTNRHFRCGIGISARCIKDRNPSFLCRLHIYVYRCCTGAGNQLQIWRTFDYFSCYIIVAGDNHISVLHLFRKFLFR